MGEIVLVLGASGTGKSTSLRNFKKGEVGIFNVGEKRLPFRNDLDIVNTSQYEVIEQAIMKNTRNAYVIDDSQFLLTRENLARSFEKGFDKFVQMALNFTQLLDICKKGTSNDTIIYLLHHPEFDDYGHMRARTPGKMIENNLGGIEGAVTITLIAQTDGENYRFITNRMPPAKSPIGMFKDKEIDNDLKAVDAVIREYYGMAPLTKVRKKEEA